MGWWGIAKRIEYMCDESERSKGLKRAPCKASLHVTAMRCTSSDCRSDCKEAGRTSFKGRNPVELKRKASLTSIISLKLHVWIKAYASSSSWLARTADVEDGLLLPFGSLASLRRHIKHAHPFDASSRFPLLNSIMHEIFFS